MAQSLPLQQTRPIIDAALRTIDLERQALEELANSFVSTNLGTSFAAVVEAIGSTHGRVIVSGMGKSGLVGRKIAATFASTGTPSFFLHPGEASHGDLGMITKDDIVLALSWSGETSELVDVLNYCARFSVMLIAITSQCQSALGRQARYCLTLPQVTEACPNNLAPTTSTTLQATLGDALAVAALELRSFSPDDFRIFHPRGQLGAKLVKMADLMSGGDVLPRVLDNATIADATLEMSAKRFGITAVTNYAGVLIGAFSDGDLRRSLTFGSMDDPVGQHMTRQPFSVSSSMLAFEALALMNARNISQLFICGDDQRLLGIVHMHDILRAGIV